MSDFSEAAQPLDRESPMPLWAQLERELRRRLDQGDFAERFPTDLEITNIYEVSRHTARHAVSRLGAEGIVKRERGRGTRVNKRPFEQSLGALYSLFQLVEQHDEEQRSKVLDVGMVSDANAADKLELDPSSELFHLSRLRLADNEPLAIDNVWLPSDIGRPLLECDFTHTALYNEMDRLKLPRPNQGYERISPVLPSIDQRQVLGMGAKQAGFSLERLGCHENRPIEWRMTVVRGDRFSFVAEWSSGRNDPLRLEAT